jgi:hypothetical protein
MSSQRKFKKTVLTHALGDELRSRENSPHSLASVTTSVTIIHCDRNSPLTPSKITATVEGYINESNRQLEENAHDDDVFFELLEKRRRELEMRPQPQTQTRHFQFEHLDLDVDADLETYARNEAVVDTDSEAPTRPGLSKALSVNSGSDLSCMSDLSNQSCRKIHLSRKPNIGPGDCDLNALSLAAVANLGELIEGDTPPNSPYQGLKKQDSGSSSAFDSPRSVSPNKKKKSSSEFSVKKLIPKFIRKRRSFALPSWQRHASMDESSSSKAGASSRGFNGNNDEEKEQDGGISRRLFQRRGTL